MIPIFRHLCYLFGWVNLAQGQKYGPRDDNFTQCCWNSIVRLNSNESVLTCVMNFELKRDYMDIGTFHYSKVAKSIPWTVISCLPSEWTYSCIYTAACFSHIAGVPVSPGPHYLTVMGWLSSRWATLWSAVPPWGTDLSGCWLIDWRFPPASGGHPEAFTPFEGLGLLPGAWRECRQGRRYFLP